MKFSVITLFPEMILNNFNQGVVGGARQAKVIEIECINPRQFTSDVHKTVDDRPFGGGDGMLMMAEPLQKSLESIADYQGSKKPKVIYLSPQGTLLNDGMATELSKDERLILICGRYAGIDQRFINQYVDEEVSIGDYVLSGGELAAAVLIDAVSRKIPGVLGHQDSSTEDSFSEQLLEEPSFTKPRIFQSQSVPEILLSGNHAKIKEWRAQLRRLVTLKKRPDLINLTDLEKRDLEQFWRQLSDQDKTALDLEIFPIKGEY